MMGMADCARRNVVPAIALEDDSPALVIREAVSYDDKYSAASIVTAEYHRKGFLAANDERTRQAQLAAILHYRTWIVDMEGVPTTTLSFTLDYPLPMEAPGLFRTELEPFRSAGLRIAEFTKFAGEQRRFPDLCFRLMAHSAKYAAPDADVMSMAVHPHHIKYFLGTSFQKLTEEVRYHPDVNNSSAIGLFAPTDQVVAHPHFKRLTRKDSRIRVVE